MADETGQRLSPIRDFLEQHGLSSDFVQKVRFRGPVGKLALVAVVCVAGLGGIGMRSGSPEVQITCVIAAFLAAVGFGAAILWYSAKYPDQATLEGMEVVVMHQQRAWAAKGMLGAPPDNSLAIVIADPAGTPPQLNPPMGADQ